jgi:hypothetical protein
MLKPIKTNCRLQPVVLIDQQGKRANGYYIYEHIDLSLFSEQPSRWTVFDKKREKYDYYGCIEAVKKVRD